MTREDYCSYEVAKLLKEKGFDWMCNGYYNKDDEDSEPYFGDGEGADNWNNQAPSVRDLWFSAPTHQMAMKWLREKHNIDIGIEASVGMPGEKAYIPMISTYKPRTDNPNKLKQYERGLYYKDDRCVIPALKKFHKYEEAVEAALKYCLTKVILKDYDQKI